MKRRFFVVTGIILFFSCGSAPRNAVPAPPRILEPRFSIAEIVILQNTLVNTRLKVRMLIDNPNDFPLELSSFKYELSAQGRYWSDGKREAVCAVPAKSSAAADLFLVMNFTSQNRALLDQVIARALIAYRFSGDAEIQTAAAAEARTFTAHFDLEGVSEVDTFH
ncbi:MAG: LEA type 2 family protein [Treponema sp.]|nr:LEA type 2 family protein [Treponema sp.]